MENNNFDDEKKTILIVDDEQKIVDLLVHNLTREGYNTIEANDGQTAIDLAISQRPDLILLDVMIPRVDGLTVCKKIKNYYVIQIKYFLTLFFLLSILNNINFYTNNYLIDFILRGLIAIVLCLIVIFIIYRKNNEFKYKIEYNKK